MHPSPLIALSACHLEPKNQCVQLGASGFVSLSISFLIWQRGQLCFLHTVIVRNKCDNTRHCLAQHLANSKCSLALRLNCQISYPMMHDSSVTCAYSWKIYNYTAFTGGELFITMKNCFLYSKRISFLLNFIFLFLFSFSFLDFSVSWETVFPLACVPFHDRLSWAYTRRLQKYQENMEL